MWKSVRKFGLEYCDLPTMTWNISFMLKLVCLLICSRHYTRISVLSYIWTLMIYIPYAYVWILSKIWYLVTHYIAIGDITTALFVFSLMITSLMGPIKLFFMHLYNDKMKEIVDEYLNVDQQVPPDSRFHKNILKVMRQVKKRAILYWIIVMGNGFVYVAKPILQPGKVFMHNLITLYGFNHINESPNYEFAYALMALSLFGICYPAANITGLHITLVGYTEAQMLALADDIAHLWSDAEQHYQETTIAGGETNAEEKTGAINANKSGTKLRVMNAFIKEHLNDIARIHAQNMYLLKKIEVLFRGAIIVQILILIMGMICYLLAGLESTYFAVPFTLAQVAVDCLTGQNVLDASIVFEKAVYDSKWENYNLANKKAILMILKNSQKNMELSAGGIAMLNFNCLMTILRITYSVYTTLLSTVK